MKNSFFYQLSLTLSLVMIMGINLVFAQGGVSVVSQTESFTQASYVLEHNGQKAEATLRKQQGLIQFKLESKNGTLLAQGSVKNDGSGNPIINIRNARVGAGPFILFILDRIVPDGNSTGLSPRKRAYKKCGEKCWDRIKSHPGWNIITVSSGSGSVSAAQLSQVKKAFQAYHKCLWKCMKEAKDRYQNR